MIQSESGYNPAKSNRFSPQKNRSIVGELLIGSVPDPGSGAFYSPDPG
jgi:hypothetical protein